MRFYMAPMEGLTGYVFRNAYQKHYGGIDRYFTPFITNKKLSHRELNDILPEHNVGMDVVPQILANRAEDFCCIARELEKYGYRTVNLNLGCPSGTVVAKNRGAGFLALPEELDRFLDEIFTKCPVGISVKTRIGKESPGEWERLLAIYEKYPLEELIVHPRVQTDYYRNSVNMEAFALAAEKSSHSLCYNGDICTAEDYDRLMARFPETEKVMLGRGLLKRPWLAEELRSSEEVITGRGLLKRPWLAEELRSVEEDCRGTVSEEAGNCADFRGTTAADIGNSADGKAEKERFRAFHDDILHGYLAVMSGDKNTLFKMKELWVYFAESFTNPEKYVKKIRKSERIAEYEIWTAALFREQEIKTGWEQ